MNLLRKTEKLIKQNWKERKRITLAVVVSFLINGGVGYTMDESEPKVDIRAKEGTQTKVQTNETGTIVDIAKPDSDGISHNFYDTFNMKGDGPKVLFNNSGKQGEGEGGSSIGFKNVHANTNFSPDTNSATLIISEITGGGSSTLEGYLEVRSDEKKERGAQGVDLIFANENGIAVNGIRYFGVESVMYVNDRDWANRDKLNQEKENNNKDGEVHPFGKKESLKELFIKEKRVEVITREKDQNGKYQMEVFTKIKKNRND